MSSFAEPVVGHRGSAVVVIVRCDLEPRCTEEIPRDDALVELCTWTTG
jgi:hypothetical protein